MQAIDKQCCQQCCLKWMCIRNKKCPLAEKNDLWEITVRKYANSAHEIIILL